METESVRSARSEPAQRLHNHRHHHHRPHRHRGGYSDRNGGAPEQQRLRGPYETDPDTDRDDRSVSTRASRVHRRVPVADGDDRGSQWGETMTVLTGATSEFNYSLEDVDERKNPENSIGFRCARYAGTVFAGLIGFVAFLSPIAMLVLPRVGIGGWQLSVCRPDCEGMLIAIGFKLLILAVGAWALFIRQPRATMPRLAVSRAGVLVLTFVLTFSFWLFYGVRIYKPDGSEIAKQNYSHNDAVDCRKPIMNHHADDSDDYIIVVRYASSLVDALLFIHYLAVILLEVRHLQAQFAVKVTRSPDGVSRTYTVGQLSVQRLASWCLDRYYRDFETYNPYLESVARRNSRRMTDFKVYDVDGVGESAAVGSSQVVGSVPAAGTRGMLASAAGQRDTGHNERFYDEQEYERRVKRRRARLIVAAEEAFTHIKRLQQEPITGKPMGPDEAAQAIFPTMARALQKYLRVTRQQPRHTMESVLQHLTQCISHELSAKAFLERYLTQGIAIWNDKDYRHTQTWSIICDRLLSRCVDDGTMLELRQGDVTLLITVRRLPHFNLVEEVLNGKGDKFVLRMNSETSV